MSASARRSDATGGPTAARRTRRSARSVCAIVGTALGCSGAAVLGLAPASQPAEVIDRVLAVAAGEVITLSDGRGAIELGLVAPAGTTEPLAEAIERLVDRELILAEVERYPPPEPDPAAVELRVELIRESFTAPEAFARALEVAGMSEQRLRDLLRGDLRIQAYLEQRFGSAAQPTEDEVIAYYQAHRQDFARDGEIRPYVEVQGVARGRLEAEQRQALIGEWTAGLRRRADVRIYYQPGGVPGRPGTRDGHAGGR